MKEYTKLEKLYSHSKLEYESLLRDGLLNEGDIYKIISNFSSESSFLLFDENNYVESSLNNLFKYYENELKNSFTEDKKLFSLKFKIYLFLLKLFISLCKNLALQKDKKVFIKNIIQRLIESKNSVKLFIPLEKNELNAINNLLGETLYKLTHIEYFSTKDKTFEYLLEYYLYSCEKIIEGYKLSLSTNFQGKETTIELEKSKASNNLSFLLLTMHYKIEFFFPSLKIDNLNNLKRIFNDLKVSPFFEEDELKNTDDLKNILIKKFINTKKYLISCNKNHYYTEKMLLLSLNTDEYKELIDIISESK